jgi:hypothetical protein
MGYGICHKLFGFVWKGQMRLLYPSTAAYATVMADVASFTGACTIALMLVSKFIFQVCAWACNGSGLDSLVVASRRSGSGQHITEVVPCREQPRWQQLNAMVNFTL